MPERPERVQLFPTCLVDHFFPDVGVAVVQILEREGIRVEIPDGLTCCGQPAYNAGFYREAGKVARYTLDILSRTEGPIAIPSGSCTSMIVHHYPVLFRDEPEILARARDVALRCYEFSQFLVDVIGYEHKGKHLPLKVAYHPSCHMSRELGVRDQPISLLEGINRIELVPFDNQEECCGFGGFFSVIQPEISTAMLERKLKAIERSGADTVMSCDMGCLMNIQGALERRDSDLFTCHIAQILNRRIG